MITLITILMTLAISCHVILTQVMKKISNDNVLKQGGNTEW